MPGRQFEEEQSGLRLRDILFILCKQKRSILWWTGAGLLGAAVVLLTMPSLYKSDAKLFVPYVVDRSAVDSVDESIKTSRDNDTIMNSEIEILTSWDLAAETAKTVHYNGLSIGSVNDPSDSELVRGIKKRIEVVANKGMNVITVSYKDPDPKLATHFLQDLLRNYRDRHLKIHRFPEALDVIVQRRDEVRTRLEETESQLKRLKEQVQSFSVADTTTSLSAAIAKCQEDLNRADADRRAQESRVATLESLLWGQGANADKLAGQRASSQEVERYRSMLDQISQLRSRESQLLLTYPADSRMVKIPRKQISDLEEQRRELENRYPELLTTAAATNPQAQTVDVVSEKARLAGLIATVETLKSQLGEFQQKREQFAELAPQIARLDRDKELLETSYKNIEATLSKAQDDKAVDWSKIPNIASVQEPSPAAKVVDPLKKKLVLGFLTGSFAIGVGLAFLRELVVDRTVKRASDLEMRLGIPVLLTIPFAKAGEFARRTAVLKDRDPDSDQNGTKEDRSAPWSRDHFIRPYCEAIRDRVILSFELRNLSHKPKLIAVTGLSKGAGSSSLAGGLAAALSETGDGRVLLVDMNAREGNVHPFFDGRVASSLTSALEPKKQIPPAAENLYLATASSGDSKQAPLGLKRFHSLVPSLKTADFDYIIFDMPPMNTVCPSLGMAAFMDKVLLVLEAERDERDSVERLYSELASARVDVSCVFNKAHSYGPSWVSSAS